MNRRLSQMIRTYVLHPEVQRAAGMRGIRPRHRVIPVLPPSQRRSSLDDIMGDIMAPQDRIQLSPAPLNDPVGDK